MSNISVGSISGLATNSNTITIPTGHKIYAPGSVVQVQTKRLDSPITYSVTGNTTSVEITDLRVSITPKFSTSLLFFNFQVHGELSGTHELMFTVHKNGTVPTGTYSGQNSYQGTQTWSGIAMALPYESDYSSTPFTQSFQYHDVPGVTSTLTYAPGLRGNSAQTYYLNRTVGSAGTTSYETGVSFATVWEIAQ